MKIGTLLTAAIVSLSAVGGGLAVYVAVSKYQTMDKVSVAQSRLEVVRAVGEIPRYMNPERGFATNILYGPAVVDPKMRAELNEKYRKQTDGARDKMNAIRKNLSGSLDDGAAVGSAIDALNSKFAALRDAIDKAIDGPAEARKDAARKIVADNAVFNTAVTALLDEQVRKMALLDGDAYRQASYANIAWTLRDVGGYNASLAQEPGRFQPRRDRSRKDGSEPRPGPHDQILMSLQQLRGNPATPANVAAALERMNEAYVGRFGQELKLVKDGAVSGKYEHDADTFFAESQKGLGSVVDVRDAFYANAEQILEQAGSSARLSFLIALAGLVAVAAGERRPRDHGPPPRLPADRRAHRDDVATRQRRRLRRHSRRRPQRRDRCDGGCRRRVQAQQDRSRSPHRASRKPKTRSRCGAPTCSTISPAPSKPR